MTAPSSRRRALPDGRQRSRLAGLPPEARELLHLLAEARHLSLPQVEHLLGPGAARVLGQLGRAGLVVRFGHRPTGEGPRLTVVGLSPLGAALLRAGGAAARRADLASALFLSHHLAVQQVRVELWRLRRDGRLADLEFREGSQARQRYRSLAVRGGEGVLTPDAQIRVEGAGGGRLSVLLEVDRGTMGRMAMERKLARYREWLADRRPPFPEAGADPLAQVWWAAADPSRRQWIDLRLREARLEFLGRVVPLEEVAASLVAAVEAGAATAREPGGGPPAGGAEGPEGGANRP